MLMRYPTPATAAIVVIARDSEYCGSIGPSSRGATGMAGRVSSHARRASHAISKAPRAYDHIEPEIVGNSRRLLVSEQSGGATIAQKAADLGYTTVTLWSGTIGTLILLVAYVLATAGCRSVVKILAVEFVLPEVRRRAGLPPLPGTSRPPPAQPAEPIG